MGEQVSRIWEFTHLGHYWTCYISNTTRQLPCFEIRWVCVACRKKVIFCFILFTFISARKHVVYPFPSSPFSSSPFSCKSPLPTIPTIRNKLLSSKTAHSISALCRSAVGQMCSLSLLHLACLSWRSGTLRRPGTDKTLIFPQGLGELSKKRQGTSLK